MEQGSKTSLPIAGSEPSKPALLPPPLATAPHERGKTVAGCKCDACEALRLKWRKKDEKRRASNPFAKPAGGGSAVIAPMPDTSGAPPPTPPAKPLVPWTVDLVKPLLEQVASILEGMDVESVAREAKKISDKCEKFVRAEFRWNPAGKLAVIEGGAECVVKYLNLAGISAEYAPEVKTAFGVIAIVHVRQSFLSEFRKIRDEERAEDLKRLKSDDKKAA